MKVLIAGGTGFIGRELCARLASDHDVTALARSPEGASLPPEVDRVAGDVTVFESIADVVEDHDAVVNLVALSPLYQQPAGAHERVHLGGTRNLVRAATAGDTERFVQVSGLDADPEGPTAFLRAKGHAEAVVRDSALEWTVVRPSMVFGEGDEIRSFTRRVTTPLVTALPGGGRIPFQPIWVGDLAEGLVRLVEDDGHGGETYEVGGPDVLTLADITRLIRGRVLIVPVPLPLVRLAFTITDPLPLVPFGRDQARALELENTVQSNDIEALGLTESSLQSMEAYLQEPS